MDTPQGRWKLLVYMHVICLNLIIGDTSKEHNAGTDPARPMINGYYGAEMK